MLSARELAAFLEVPLSTIYFWRYRGEGPRAMRVGRCLRFSMADVRAWLERRAD
ncbi:MAG: helix-turn-helix domain-containing protein [Actinomycetota bacterium]|nr:helix-turn-helix domain-containing protein [Actinomycetota bacterium]